MAKAAGVETLFDKPGKGAGITITNHPLILYSLGSHISSLARRVEDLNREEKEEGACVAEVLR